MPFGQEEQERGKLVTSAFSSVHVQFGGAPLCGTNLAMTKSHSKKKATENLTITVPGIYDSVNEFGISTPPHVVLVCVPAVYHSTWHGCCRGAYLCLLFWKSFTILAIFVVLVV